MKHQDLTNIVPAQFTGKEIEADATVEMKAENEAKTFYETAKDRLLRVNNWHKLAGTISAKFQLVDDKGILVDRQATKGDYLRIDIPGPGSLEGDGYDWVRIEELKEVDTGDNQSIGFRVRPSTNPLGDEKETAHFYSPTATSVFTVSREGSKVIAWIIDNNIKPNEKTDTLADKIRDIAVGVGAIGMFSKIQWQHLAEGLIKTENNDPDQTVSEMISIL